MGFIPRRLENVLIATTERGICNLSFVDGSEGKAIDNLVADWRQAKMIEDYKSTAPLVTRIFSDLKLIHLSSFIYAGQISRSKFGKHCSTFHQAH
jgi:hypothetical protein